MRPTRKRRPLVVGLGVKEMPNSLCIMPPLAGDEARQRKHESLYWEYAGTIAVRAGMVRENVGQVILP
ncbi:MAG: hypothetical protein NTW21_01080 [Verrucomicrobia bacterium]|nr:hypothetical protein [Verrucomicrobiota bacterium]